MPRQTRPAVPACVLIVCLAAVAGCDRDGVGNAAPGAAPAAGGSAAPAASLAEARRGFTTKLLRKEADGEPAPEPPAQSFELVRYDAPPGKLVAYVSRVPAGAAKWPVIVWLFGGFSNGIGETAWEPAPPSNDQSARAFREGGVVTMYPSLRGGNDNPGFKEGFLGEVDDVLAAAEFLARHDSVDPTRVYLGGHSTGGTLALLAAAAAPPGRFRAVFAFGPAADACDYGQEVLPFDVDDERECAVRSPARWAATVRTPVFVLEGAGDPGNIPALQDLAAAAKGNPAVRFHAVDLANHSSILAPATKLLAAKVMADTGPSTNIAISEQELGRMLRG